jgi:hypothetical protein
VSESSDTLIILSAIKYATSRGDSLYEITMDTLGNVCRKATWTGKRFILSGEQREELKALVPPAYWTGTINDNLEAE